jgi:hypothetical protein
MLMKLDLETLREKEKDEEIINLLTSIQKIQSKQPKRDQLITFIENMMRIIFW